MTSRARAVAVQGVGFGPKQLVAQGLLPEAAQRPAVCLNPRAIVVQGVGFSPKFLAVQGLKCDKETVYPKGPAARRAPVRRRRRQDEDDALLLLLLR